MHKYLAQYGETEVELCLPLLDTLKAQNLRFAQVLCIPFYDESLALLDSIQIAAAQSYKTNQQASLLILLINHPDNKANCAQNTQAQLTLKTLECIWQAAHLSLYAYSNELYILCIERIEHLALPHKQGVGLARKIACDCASLLIHEGYVSSTFIYSSDSDVYFPIDYFLLEKPAKPISAFVLNYQHSYQLNHQNSAINEDQEAAALEIEQATQTYELSIKYYEALLRFANSSYAFQTIGSCLVIENTFYLQARGFPKRAAGEDFYLLNKLNKLAPVHSLSKPSLQIQPRLSSRVPFGTGPAVNAFIEGKSAIFYHPACSILLKHFLIGLNALAALEQPIEDTNLTSCFQTLCQADDLDAKIQTSLLTQLAITLKLSQIQGKFLRQYKTRAQRQKAYHDWFDGFQTLKAIHLFTQVYPKLEQAELEALLSHNSFSPIKDSLNNAGITL